MWVLLLLHHCGYGVISFFVRMKIGVRSLMQFKWNPKRENINLNFKITRLGFFPAFFPLCPLYAMVKPQIGRVEGGGSAKLGETHVPFGAQPKKIWCKRTAKNAKPPPPPKTSRDFWVAPFPFGPQKPKRGRLVAGEKKLDLIKGVGGKSFFCLINCWPPQWGDLSPR